DGRSWTARRTNEGQLCGACGRARGSDGPGPSGASVGLRAGDVECQGHGSQTSRVAPAHRALAGNRGVRTRRVLVGRISFSGDAVLPAGPRAGSEPRG